MTWKRTLWVMLFVMLAVWISVYFILSRQEIPGNELSVLGVRSVFPAGNYAAVPDAKNGWQGFGFSGNFRFFSRPSARAGEDFKELIKKNFSHLSLKTELSLFEGGFYALQKSGKGYRLFCLFFKGPMNYWADMHSADSLHFSRQAFERFMLNLEIDGEKVSPAVTGQMAALRRRISPFFMQTPGLVLGFMAGICLFTLWMTAMINSFAGSSPRRFDMPVEALTPGATLSVRRAGRRRVTACCLCLQGESLVIYRFRRPYLTIDIRRERQDIIWGKKSFRYKNIRVILDNDSFQNWRLRLMA
jgi:hypothetical protein